MNVNYNFKKIPINIGLKTSETKGVKLNLKSVLSFVMICVFSSLTQSQTTYTSVVSGNYSSPATWGTTTAPTAVDNVIISTGTTVTLNQLITVNNVTITGIIESNASSENFIVNGNFTVNSGGLFKGIYFFDAGGFGYNRGIQLSVAGNITNNGRIDLSDGSNYSPEGVLFLNGSTVQTVNGLGTFGGTSFTTDSMNTGSVINQLLINNTNTASPNVIWGFNNIKIKSSITLTSAKVALGTNKMTIGNYSSATTSVSNGSGFVTGTIGRWYDVYSNYNVIPPSSDYYNSNLVFPFVNATGKSRAAFITRPSDNNYSGVSGELSVSYFDDTTVTSGYSIVDGSYTVTHIFDGAWIVAKDATYSFPIGNHSIAFSIQDAYLIKNGNSRIIKADGSIIGTHQNGTITPFASRIGLSDTNLNNTFQVGYNAALDTPITSIQSGNWNSASTWSNNSIPSCANTMTILPGHTVTVDTPSSAGGVNISSGASLISNASSLTIGCTNNNASFINNGTYTINSGLLTVNGNILHNNGSTFNQTGGDIIVDGNNNGTIATSIEQTLFKIGSATLNLTGGKITLVDPPVSNTTLATTHMATSIIPCSGFFCFFTSDIILDSVVGIAVGQVVVGIGVPAGTTVAQINFDGSINTSPSLPETGLTLPLSLTFYNVANPVSAFIYDSNNNYAAGINHTLQIGDGISIEKSAVTLNGFNCNFRAANGTLSLNNLIINAPDSTNRFVNLDNTNSNSNIVVMNVQNNFTITQGKVKGAGVDTYFGGNIINNGALNTNNSTYFGNYLNGNSEPTSKPQTISGTGTFNAQTDVILNNPSNTGSVNQLRVDNISVAGVTFMVPFSIVTSLTMNAGIIHTSATSVLKVGTPAMNFTASVNGNFGENCYIDGPFSKDIGGGQVATGLNSEFGFVVERFFFPVGKTSYKPIWVGVTTPAGNFGSPGTNLKVEAFETNTGTNSANTAFISQNRWEVSKTAGTVIDFNIRVADPTATANSIIVQAPSAAGVYDNDFGITSTFVTGTPNTLTSTSNPLPFANFEGYFSTARQSQCTMVNPGNTLASETSICNGKSVKLSLQNVVIGEGITYQWQSSATGMIFTNIDGAIATTTSVAPVSNTFYRCNVTCSFSTTTVASTSIQISLNNTIITSTPATICEPTNVATLAATSSSGDVKWYNAQVGGTTLGTGNSFTTPVITATTTYYAGTETTIAGTAGLTYTQDGYGSGGINKGLAFNLSNSIILNSVKVFPQQSQGGPLPMTIKVLQNGIQVPGTNAVIFTPSTFPGFSPTNTPQTVTLNYQLAAGNNYSLEITDGITYDNALATITPFPNPYPITNGAVSIVGAIDNNFIDTYGYNFFFSWDVTEVCSSARIPVIATVQTAANCTLGTTIISDTLARVVAYPNPYNTTFKIDIQSNNSANVEIKVYDMLGRLIENRTVIFNEISNVEIGNGYPSGIYNVLVKQEGITKTLHVIKR